MRYLGIDYGSKRVGLALSDEAGTMGFPYAVWKNTNMLLDEVCALIARENIGGVVLGESKNLDGTDNPIAEQVHSFGKALTERSGIPVAYESEVFTSEEARHAPHKMAKTRSPKTHAAIDHSAAALILTSYLSHTHHG